MAAYITSETFKRIHPDEYYKRFLSQGVRPDGRSLLSVRTTSLNVGSVQTADGSALARIGKTIMVCGIKAELAVPPVASPNRGYFVPNISLPPMCAAKFRPGPPSDYAQAMSELLNRIAADGHLVDLQELCIVPGELAWCLYADVYCIAYDGNVLDAATLALSAAVSDLKLPPIGIENGRPARVAGERSPLKTVRHVFSLSLRAMEGGILFADPTNDEEDLDGCAVSVAFGADGRMVCLHRPGGMFLSKSAVDDCVAHARARVAECEKLLSAALSAS